MMDPPKLTALGEETRGYPPKQIRKICRSLREAPELPMTPEAPSRTMTQGKRA
jgi:hypothetical protein